MWNQNSARDFKVHVRNCSAAPQTEAAAQSLSLGFFEVVIETKVGMGS